MSHYASQQKFVKYIHSDSWRWIRSLHATPVIPGIDLYTVQLGSTIDEGTREQLWVESGGGRSALLFQESIYIYKLIPSVGELEIFSEMEPISNRSSGPITNVPPPPPSVIDFNYVSTSTFGRVTPAYRTEFRITGRKLFPSGKITVGIQETRWKTFIRVCKSSLRRDILSARFAYSFKNIIRRPYPLEGRILF